MGSAVSIGRFSNWAWAIKSRSKGRGDALEGYKRIFKELITSFFKEFMELFFPEAHALVVCLLCRLNITL